MNQDKIRGTTKGGDPRNWVELALASLQGVMISFFVVILLLVGVAFAISKGTIQQADMEGAVFASAFLASTLGALYSLWKINNEGMIWGILVSFLFFLFLFLLGFCFSPNIEQRTGDFELFFAILCGGAVAKILLRKKKKNKKKS